jgi:nitrilase
MPSNLHLATSKSHTLSTTAPTLPTLESTTHHAEAQASDLLLLPEDYLGGYPRTATFGSAIGLQDPAGREQYLNYFKDAMDDTPESR